MKKFINYYLLLPLCALLFSCHTYTTQTGHKYRQLFPAKDKTDASHRDTAHYVTQPFSLSNFNDRVSVKNGKKLVEIISAADLKTLTASGKRYTLYFLNPDCSHPTSKIAWLDSSAQQGEDIVILSLYNDYTAVNNILRPTIFHRYPYYIIHNTANTHIVLDRQRNLLRDAFLEDYKLYKDGIINAEYFVIDKGKLTVVR